MGDYAPMTNAEVPKRPQPDDMEKFGYWFDNFFATNPMAKVYCLCVVNIVFMVFFACCFHVMGSQGGDWVENFWMGFTFAADMAEDDHGGPFPYWKEWIFRGFNFWFSFGGAMVFGMVINFLSSYIDDKVTSLRQGKSKVLESGHTLILGWNDRVLSLVTQICEANISENGLPIVILADEDKEGMDEYFMDAIEDRLGSKIITRGGSRIECTQLCKVAVERARSIVVLSVGDDPDEADAQSVRCVLALTGGLAAIGKAPTCHLVVELQDVDNADVAMLGVVAPMVPEDTVIPVVSHDIIGHYEDGMTGKTFTDACYRFEDACVIGVRFANPSDPKVREVNPEGRPVMLNPSGDYIMQYGDRILVLAEDNDTYDYGTSHCPNATPMPPFELPPPEPEKFLLCGWRRDFDDLITELDKWVPENSSLTLLNGFEEEKMKRMLADGGMATPKNITTIEYVTGDPCRGRCIERLGPKIHEDEPDDRTPGSAFRIEEYDSILMLSEEGRAAGMSADSRVMVSMLVMRHIQVSRKTDKAILVTEIRDPRTQDLMEFTKCNDAVVGNELVAMILAQISEDRDLGYVMEDLFSEEGMEMHIKDIRLFAAPDELLSWWDIVSRCTARNMLPIGWIRKNGDDSQPWSANLNPGTSEEDVANGITKSTRLAWTGMDYPHGDQLIVISED